MPTPGEELTIVDPTVVVSEEQALLILRAFEDTPTIVGHMVTSGLVANLEEAEVYASSVLERGSITACGPDVLPSPWPWSA